MLVLKLIRSTLATLLLLAAFPAFADFIVNTDSDADDGSDGACSVREAIIAVNNQADYHECTSANVGESFVSFAIPPNLGEVHTIALASALPLIRHFISIDGTSQSGTVCTPVPNLRVQITNPSVLAVDGLSLDTNSDLSTISGVAISGFSPAGSAGILVSSNDTVIGCVISGTNASGTAAQPNYYGIYVNGQDTTVGVSTGSQWLPNLFSGNKLANVFVDAGGSDSVVAGNYIGVDSSGVTPFPTPFGVYALEVAGLRVGYSGSGGPPERERNIIGITSPPSTTAVNVEFDHTIDSTLDGNYVGLGADGLTSVPIGTGIGVSVYQSSGTLVGCDGNTTAEFCRNVIVNPTAVAVQNFEGSTGTAIVGNFLDIAADGTTVFSSTQNTIAIAMSGADALVARNLITTGGAGTGILLGPDSANQTPVFLNQTAAGNGGAVLDSSYNCVQGNAAGVDTDIASNPTVQSTDFLNNWWGAADGPAPNGSGNSTTSNVNYTPFLTAPSPYCNVNAESIFANGFE